GRLVDSPVLAPARASVGRTDEVRRSSAGPAVRGGSRRGARVRSGVETAPNGGDVATVGGASATLCVPREPAGPPHVDGLCDGSRVCASRIVVERTIVRADPIYAHQ